MSAPSARARGITLAVASGKGGVGKTTVTANLAACLARRGLAVTVVDGDLGLANLDLHLGVSPGKTLAHFFREGASLDAIARRGPLGMRVVPSGSGVPELTALDPAQMALLETGLATVLGTSDVGLIDTPAGIGTNTLGLTGLADRLLLVAWPDPAALVDVYAAAKAIHAVHPSLALELLVNGVEGECEALRVHAALTETARRCLGRPIGLAGWVPFDAQVAAAARTRLPVAIERPGADASLAFDRVAEWVASLAPCHSTRRCDVAEPSEELEAVEVIH